MVAPCFVRVLRKLIVLTVKLLFYTKGYEETCCKLTKIKNFEIFFANLLYFC